MSNKYIELEEYIDLLQLTEQKSSSHETNRQYGLVNEQLLDTPVLLLKQWIREHRYLLSNPLISLKFSSYLNRVSALLLLASFLLGIFSGVGLLSYSGHEPVNVLYFLGVVLLLPLITMSMTLWAMIRANQSSNMLIHISPAYWMERIVALLPDKSQELLSKLHINPQIGNWMTIWRSQLLALGFSLGLFLALLGVVATRDIAFGWSSTLRISPQELHHLFSFVALPWSTILPEALPSLELIEKSHYFRLGGELSVDMIKSASLLGEWWKFLLMSTLFYALFLRLILFFVAGIGLRKALERGALSMDSVREMLREMRTPLITTEAIEHEELLQIDDEIVEVVHTPLDKSFTSVIGWAMDSETIAMHNDRKAIYGEEIYEVGGIHSLESDDQIIESITTDTLLYVKSWEPPTMDFVDFLTLLAKRGEFSITLYPLGIAENGYEATERDYTMWSQKIAGVRLDNVRMKR